MTNNNTSWIISLLNIKGIGRKTAHEIIKLASTFEEVNLFALLESNKDKLRVKDFDHLMIEDGIEKKNNIVDKSYDLGIKWITIIDDQYPEQLKKTSDPPLVLYYKGNIDVLQDVPGVAIIGTRNPTPHGAEVGKRLGVRFAAENLNIVSGLAKGCDTAGHEGALEGGGFTTAVLAQPLDKIYPKENRPLADEILSNRGVLVSEYPVGAKTGRSAFVERDRIQAGLSRATIVVETDVEGGTMHTVKFTEEYGRLLFAYFNDHKLGYLDNKQTKGNQLLINDKRAVPLSNEQDILSAAYSIRNQIAHNRPSVNDNEQKGLINKSGQMNLKF